MTAEIFSKRNAKKRWLQTVGNCLTSQLVEIRCCKRKAVYPFWTHGFLLLLSYYFELYLSYCNIVIRILENFYTTSNSTT